MPRYLPAPAASLLRPFLGPLLQTFGVLEPSHSAGDDRRQPGLFSCCGQESRTADGDRATAPRVRRLKLACPGLKWGRVSVWSRKLAGDLIPASPTTMSSELKESTSERQGDASGGAPRYCSETSGSHWIQFLKLEGEQGHSGKWDGNQKGSPFPAMRFSPVTLMTPVTPPSRPSAGGRLVQRSYVVFRWSRSASEVPQVASLASQRHQKANRGFSFFYND